MRWSYEPSADQPRLDSRPFLWSEPVLGILVGAGCAVLGRAQFAASLPKSILLGALFGLLFFVAFAQRTHSPGEGLIWGLGSALLAWLLIPVGLIPLLNSAARSSAMLTDARARFPELVAYLVLLGTPVGLTFGILGASRCGVA